MAACQVKSTRGPDKHFPVSLFYPAGNSDVTWIRTFPEEVEGWGNDEDEGEEDQEPHKPGVGSNNCKVVRDLLQSSD